ncbi:Precorrin-6A reductase [Pseudogemmobacter humi]|uniref:Precorrin-6A reductase n=1 Tax=Pseudogemmobacter humi TaxID=2483812 RepID=A0A3P5WK49_9RHOB|nr:Precorrin-6A reductase [Pseudogemmobacter humi]
MAGAGLSAVLSYAGRVESPRAQPVPVRTGGFGGAEGLAGYLRTHRISHLIDATHPFAAQMSTNAALAAQETGVPLIRLERPAWRPGPGDAWTPVPDIAEAVQATGETPRRIFLAIGRQHLAPFAARPQHHYLLRLVDPPVSSLPLPQVTLEIARGPFDTASDRALMQRHGIQMIVAKNAGGAGASAKLTAARDLGLPVVMIDRPRLPEAPTAASPEDVLAWLHADLGV